MEQREIAGVVRMGTVSDVDAQARTARVICKDCDNMVSAQLPVLWTAAPWLPEVGETVVCLHIPGGEGDGYVIGRR